MASAGVPTRVETFIRALPSCSSRHRARTISGALPNEITDPAAPSTAAPAGSRRGEVQPDIVPVRIAEPRFPPQIGHVGAILPEHDAPSLAPPFDLALKVGALEEQLRTRGRWRRAGHLDRQRFVAVGAAKARIARRSMDDRHEAERATKGDRALEIGDDQGHVVQPHRIVLARFTRGAIFPAHRVHRRRRLVDRARTAARLYGREMLDHQRRRVGASGPADAHDRVPPLLAIACSLLARSLVQELRARILLENDQAEHQRNSTCRWRPCADSPAHRVISHAASARWRR